MTTTIKKNAWLLLVIIIIGGAYWLIRQSQPISSRPSAPAFVLDPKNCTYHVENQDISLVNGLSEKQVVPGSATKIVTKYFGNEVKGDFNQDGFPDVAFFLSQETGGSGTFYYVVAALGSQNACHGTNAVFLGDRIAPNSINFQSGIIMVNYAIRNKDEAMTVAPSIGITKYLQVVDGQLVEQPGAAK